jgi:hypothetical protein
MYPDISGNASGCIRHDMLVLKLDFLAWLSLDLLIEIPVVGLSNAEPLLHEPEHLQFNGDEFIGIFFFD